MIDYKIIRANTRTLLEDAVRNCLVAGWELVGGATYSAQQFNEPWIQTIVRNTKYGK